MTQTERDNIIKQGVQIRRNTYRGKDITELWKSGELYKQIESGKFDDIYVGDYIVSEKTIKIDEQDQPIVWLIADLDNYWGTGDQGKGLQTHHATIIPSCQLQGAKMNSTNITEGGYLESEMIKTLDEIILPNFIEPDFKDKSGKSHIIEYRNLVSSDTDDALSNQSGNNSGASSNWTWVNRKLDLMSEVNVYGTTIISSSYYDIGVDNRQYAIFQLRPELINQAVNGIVEMTTRRYSYWLKAVTSSTNFAGVDYNGGSSNYGAASYSLGIRPRFLID